MGVNISVSEKAFNKLQKMIDDDFYFSKDPGCILEGLIENDYCDYTAMMREQKKFLKELEKQRAKKNRA